MRFGGPDGVFGGILYVHIRGPHMVICFPLLIGGAEILLAGLIVQDLEVNFVAVFFYARADVVVFYNSIVVVFGSEGLYKYDIAVAVLSQHNM